MAIHMAIGSTCAAGGIIGGFSSLMMDESDLSAWRSTTSDLWTDSTVVSVVVDVSLGMCSGSSSLTSNVA